MSRFLEDFKDFLIENNENICNVGEYRVGEEAGMIEIQQCNACNNIYSVSKLDSDYLKEVAIHLGIVNRVGTSETILRRQMMCRVVRGYAFGAML